MQTAEKIANFLLSLEQANKDLAFTLMEGQGVDFDEVMDLLRPHLLDKESIIDNYSYFKLDISGYRLSIGRYYWGEITYYVYHWCDKKKRWISMVNSLALYTSESYIVSFFIKKVKLKYNETRQSNHHNQ